MGHIMMRTMRRAQEALCALTLDADGVDGPAIYLYGEAWDFGEVAGNQRGTNATQLNAAGSGLGAAPRPLAWPIPESAHVHVLFARSIIAERLLLVTP